MKTNEQVEKFRQIVKNKFQIYNSLFMSLPYDKNDQYRNALTFFSMKRVKKAMKMENLRWR